MDGFFENLLHEFQLPLSNPVISFAVMLAIILLSPILLKKINVPGIVGLIISGVIIGPHGLNIIENNDAVQLFSTIGLLYIMFIAGLELDMNEFVKNRKKSLIYGTLAFVIPLVLTFPFVYLLLRYSLSGAMIIACMTATHTLIAYPIVSRMGLARNKAVIVVVGGTALTDTVVLMLLAIIMESVEGALTFLFWVRLILSLAVFLFIMFWGIPKLARWFFGRLESEKASHYIFVLAVMFISAFLAEVAGLEPVIGAFIAGLAINRQIPRSSTLMNRIEFVGNALFIPFFLISVGMMVDMSVVMGGPTTLILAAVLVFTTFLGKWLAVYLSQKIFGYSLSQRNVMFGLSISHAAATLAIILVGYNAGVVDNNTLNATIILILVTCITASFVTEKASKKLLVEEHEDNEIQVDLSSPVNQHILIPIANVRNMENLIDMALLLKSKKSYNPITLLTVVPNDVQAEQNIIRMRTELESIVKYASAAEQNVESRAAISPSVSGGIARTSREIVADTIILGWPEQKGVISRIIGGGDVVDSIVNTVDRRIIICDICKPLVKHQRMLLVIPPFAEHEEDFSGWLRDIGSIAKELSLSIECICNNDTFVAVVQSAKLLSINCKIRHSELTPSGYLIDVLNNMQEDDLVVMVSSRMGYVSFDRAAELLPEKLEAELPYRSKILVYPQQIHE